MIDPTQYGIPALSEDQDERCSLLVLRKAADSPQPTPEQSASSVQAVAALVTDLGYDLEQSYIVTSGTDNDGELSGTLAELVAAEGGSDPEPDPEG